MESTDEEIFETGDKSLIKEGWNNLQDMLIKEAIFVFNEDKRCNLGVKVCSDSRQIQFLLKESSFGDFKPEEERIKSGDPTHNCLCCRKKIKKLDCDWDDYCEICEKLFLLALKKMMKRLCFFCNDVLPAKKTGWMILSPHGNGVPHTLLAHYLINNKEGAWGGLLTAWIKKGQPACPECVSKNPLLLQNGQEIIRGITAISVQNTDEFSEIIRGKNQIFANVIGGAFIPKEVAVLQIVAAEANKKLLILPRDGHSLVYFYSNHLP